MYIIICFILQTEIDNQETQLSLRVSSLSSTLTKEHITAYFEAQGDDISVTSVEFPENGTAIVQLVDITDKGIDCCTYHCM